MSVIFDRYPLIEKMKNQWDYADVRYDIFKSTHEGYGVLSEEVSELLEAIHSNDAVAIREEAIQVAAVAMRIAECLDSEDVRKRSRCE